MFEFVNYTADKLQLFLLVMLRASGLFLLAPILGHKSFPASAKVGLVVVLSLILMSTLSNNGIPAVLTFGELVTVALKELFVGASIGFLFSLLMMGVQGAGELVSYQIGFTMASVVDPQSGGEISVLSTFWVLMATLIFMALNGQHLLITALADSYLVLPPGQVSLGGSVAEMIIGYSAYVFVIALKIAAPVIVTLLLTDVALGSLSRLMPTMNVFIVGFGLKVAVGLGIMAMALPVFAFVLEKAVGYLNEELGHLLMAMGKA